jgi:hypothetical protein
MRNNAISIFWHDLQIHIVQFYLFWKIIFQQCQKVLLFRAVENWILGPNTISGANFKLGINLVLGENSKFDENSNLENIFFYKGEYI